MAVATIAAGSSLSRRMEIEQVSMVTNSQRLPGSAAARRAAVARPLTPPAQPSPKIGTRRTLSRRPMPRPDAGVEAGRRDTGRRDGDDPVDLGRAQGPPVRSPRRPLPRTSAPQASQIDAVAFVPAVRVFVPVDRGDDVALGDPGIVEHARQPVEQGFPAPPNARERVGFRFRLVRRCAVERPWPGREGCKVARRDL